jgi:hypothetical protein
MSPSALHRASPTTTVPMVGLVAGTEDSTPLIFRVAISEDSYLQLDDVVVTLRQLRGVGPVSTAGVVTQIRARHEGASFGSDVFLISDGVLPAHVQELAEVTTTRVDPELYVPPLPGARTMRAPGADRDKALYFDQMPSKIPVGLGRDGEPIFVNLEFVDGTRGAHVSISGISGVAIPLFGEPITISLALGLGFIVGGVTLFNLSRKPRRRNQPISADARLQIGLPLTYPQRTDTQEH